MLNNSSIVNLNIELNDLKTKIKSDVFKEYEGLQVKIWRKEEEIFKASIPLITDKYVNDIENNRYYYFIGIKESSPNNKDTFEVIEILPKSIRKFDLYCSNCYGIFSKGLEITKEDFENKFHEVMAHLKEQFFMIK